MNSTVIALPGVDPRATGLARVSPEELRSKLGHTAWHVWSILCRVREHHSTVHITVGGIARMRGFVRISQPAVRRALQVLKKAGLVRDIGWKVREVPWRRSTRKQRVFLREVFGAQQLGKRRIVTWTDAEEGPTDEVVVPSTTAEWLRTAPGWGGARVGAGRPRKGSTVAKKPQALQSPQGKKNSSVPVAGVQAVQYPQGKKNSSVTVARNSSVTPYIMINDLPLVSSGIESSSKEEDAPPAAQLISSWDEDRLGMATGTPSAGYTLGPASVMQGVPPYPSVGLVMPARVPAPPLLDPDVSQITNARIIVRSFNGAVERRTGKRCGVLSHGDLRRSKYWKLLCGSIDALVEHEIPPTSWALFSLDVFRDFGGESAPGKAKRLGKAKRAPFPWVWGAKRIDERHGWFRQEAGGYGGGRLVFGPRHRYLLKTYEQMRKHLRNRGDLTVEQVVAQHFPPKADYERCTASARTESEDQTRRMRQRMQRGEFLWG